MRSFGSVLAYGRTAFLNPAVIGLLAWSAPAWPQAPPETDPATILETGRKAALEYVRSLPDFVCTEVIERYAAPNGQRRLGDWLLKDTLTVQLGYFEHKDSHKLTRIDGHPTNRTFESVGGSIGWGEFGGILHSVFDPSSAASFRWERWRNVRRRRAAVFSYVVQQRYSSYLLVSGPPDNPRKAVVGYHGELEIDQETGAVFRLTYEADSIPMELRCNSAITTVDYDFTDVGGKNYVLPASSETVMQSPNGWTRNHMAFRNYGKFTSDSVIIFGDAR